MKVELYADSKNKKDTKLIVNDKNIDLTKCTKFFVDIDARDDNFITILALGGTVKEQILNEVEKYVKE